MRTVGDDRFLSNREAADRLGKLSVGWLVFSGVLIAVRSPDGRQGVTVESVEREMVWQRRASREMKVRRSLRGVLRVLDLT